MASFPAFCSRLSCRARYCVQGLEFSHDQDGRCSGAAFSIAESVEGSGTVSGDLLKCSGGEILFGACVMAAADVGMLRDLARAADFLLVGRLRPN